jgi:hypothetical protein
MLPAFVLSACTTVEVSLHAPSCFSEMVAASGLEKPTPHAPLPSEPTAGAWVTYGNTEGGQLDIANADKAAVVGIGQTCDRWADEAKKKLEKRGFFARLFG